MKMVKKRTKYRCIGLNFKAENSFVLLSLFEINPDSHLRLSEPCSLVTWNGSRVYTSVVRIEPGNSPKRPN